MTENTQSGQAQRGFLRIFGHPQDEEFHRLLQSMSRFTTCEDPLAVILFRALDAVSAEHDAQGDFIGVRAIDGAQRRQAGWSDATVKDRVCPGDASATLDGELLDRTYAGASDDHVERKYRRRL